MRPKIIIWFLLINIFQSCSVTVINLQELPGRYEYHGTTLTLNSDSTFEYYISRGLTETCIEGNYKIQGRTEILLNSDPSQEEQPFPIEEDCSTSNDSIWILIQDENEFSLKSVSCAIYVDSKLIGGTVSDNLGVCAFDNRKFDEVEITYVGFEDVKIDLRKIECPKLTVTLMEERYHEYFIDRKLRFIRSGIVDRNFGKGNRITLEKIVTR